MATLRDIARRAEVSVAAVSLVLNNRTREARIAAATARRIRRVADELGYRPHYFARSLRTNRTSLIGVTVWDLGDPYFGEILRGIEEVLRREDYKLMISGADRTHAGIERCVDEFDHLGVAGLLVLGGASDEPGRWNMERFAPAVIVGGQIESGAAGAVMVDNVHGGEIGARYLIGRGYERLLYVARRSRTVDEEERLRGFLGVADDGPVGYDVLEIDHEQSGAYEATRTALGGMSGRIGVFAEDDLLAIGAMRAVVDLERPIPTEVGVLGFDDLSFCRYLSPRLTTIRQPRLEMGRRAALELVRIQADERLERRVGRAVTPIVLKPELQIRESA